MEITQLKHIQCYEQFMGIRFCPKHKHFNGLNILKVATRMCYMTLALDKGCGRQPLVVDNQEQHQTQNGWKKYIIHLKQIAQLHSE